MAEPTATAAEQRPQRKLPLKTILVIVGILFLEGGTITLFKVLHTPGAAQGSDDPIAQTVEAAQPRVAEVMLVDQFTVVNYVAGRNRMIISLKVSASVSADNKEALAAKVADHRGEIMDTIRTLVSAAPPDQIKDPDLQVIKREMKVRLEKILGEGTIGEVLLPEWQPFTQD
jgi:flagellar basal body-associated protein FliL